MVQQLADPWGPSANQLAKEVGVHQSTLSRWLRAAGRVDGDGLYPVDPPRRTMAARRPQDWSAEEKLAAVLEAAAIPEEELGAFLRRQGLHEAHLRRWREQMLGALQEPRARPSAKNGSEARELRELKKELARKEKALAEAAALLVLQKKVQALWGDADDDTGKKSGK